MARQVIIKASEGHHAFGKLLEQIYDSDEHLIVDHPDPAAPVPTQAFTALRIFS